MTRKKILTSIGCVVLCVACAFMAIGFTACGDDSGSTSGSTSGSDSSGSTETTVTEDKDITGVTFEDTIFVYDGTEKEITVSGTVPSGVSVTYTNNKATEAGKYTATATLSGTGYKTLVLTATFEILLEITGVTFEDVSVAYDGTEKEITVSGTIPSGVSVTYENNKGTEIGEYNATATLSGDGYVTLVLTATLKIVDRTEFAQSLMDLVFEFPDPWSYLPSGLREENIGYTESQIQDFSTWTNVSSMNKKFVGLQLNVLYTIMDYTVTALSYVDSITSIGTTIASLYQTFINNNPDNYADFEMNILGFKVFIELTDTDYSILVGNSTISMELVYDLETGMRSGRIQVTSGITMKYEYNDNYIKEALTLTVSGVGAYYELELTKENGVTSGYAFERYGSQELIGIDSAAVIRCESDYTYVYSAQRETLDLSVNGYEEVYDTKTGEYLGGEIEESLSSINYDTYWFNLYDVTGINNVMVTEDSKIYINNVESSISTKMYGSSDGWSKYTSRRYDIELKTVYYYIKSTDGGNTTYTKTKYSIPMIFVQKEKVGDFSSDIVEKNPNLFTVTPTLPTLPQTLLGNTYSSMKTEYTNICNTVTTSTITDYIGEKNELFNKEISDTYEEGDTNDGE